MGITRPLTIKKWLLHHLDKKYVTFLQNLVFLLPVVQHILEYKKQNKVQHLFLEKSPLASGSEVDEWSEPGCQNLQRSPASATSEHNRIPSKVECASFGS